MHTRPHVVWTVRPCTCVSSSQEGAVITPLGPHSAARSLARRQCLARSLASTQTTTTGDGRPLGERGGARRFWGAAPDPAPLGALLLHLRHLVQRMPPWVRAGGPPGSPWPCHTAVSRQGHALRCGCRSLPLVGRGSLDGSLRSCGPPVHEPGGARRASPAAHTAALGCTHLLR
jgi:hypothetical protein